MARVEANINGIASMACASIFAASMFVATVGCSTASSLGLPVASGPHRLMPVAKKFRDGAGLPVSLPRELAKSVVPEYRVEPGDVLVVEPDSFDTSIRLPSDQPVQLDGTIQLGRFGQLSVAGKSLPEIEREVRQLIKRQLLDETSDGLEESEERRAADASVSVRLLSRESKVFYVIGEVNAPGAYPLVGRETILDAIMTAGGLTDRANEHKLIFVRPTGPEECRLVLPVCYRQIVQLGDTSTNYQVKPGDRIYVPSFTFHDDLKHFLTMGHEESCPRCATAPVHCLPLVDCRRDSLCAHCQAAGQHPH
jgi:polysaccharide export outer membrane protein